MPRRQWKPQMTLSELYRGWIFFGVYLFVFPFLMGQIQRFASDREVFLPVAETNVAYYLLSTVLLLLLLWSFLKNGFYLLLDWMPENLFAFGTGLGGYLIINTLIHFLPMPVENPTVTDYPAQFALSPYATAVLLVVLIPIVEEVLFRGLLFGSLRRYSRPLAYVLSTVLFALYVVWQWALGFGNPRYFLLIIQYLPMSLAFTWCYDQGGSIWSAIALHMAVSGFGLLTVLN